MLIWSRSGGSPFLRVIKLMKPEAFGEAGNEKALPTHKVAFLLRHYKGQTKEIKSRKLRHMLSVCGW